MSLHVDMVTNSGFLKKILSGFWAQPFIWLLVSMPVWLILVDYLTINVDIPGIPFWDLLVFSLTVLLIAFDKHHLRKQGCRSPSPAWLLLYPGYLWRRDSVLKRRHRYFWMWIFFLVLSILIDELIYYYCN